GTWVPSRRRRAAQQGGAHLAAPHPSGAGRAVPPAIGHFARTAHGNRRRRLPKGDQMARTRPRLWREQAVEPHGHRQDQVPEEHRLESPRQPQARETEQREPRAKPQRPRGAENHVVGTSVLSRIALSAASGVRSEERRVGKECKAWGWPCDEQKSAESSYLY